MQKEFWHRRWQTNQIGFNQPHPNPFLLQYLPSLALKPGNRVFVPLCGKSIDMLWLANQGFDVVGVELSSIACNAFFNEHSIPVEIIESDKFTIYQSNKITLLSGDFFDLSQHQIGEINAVYDRAALVALPATLRQRYVKFLIEIINKSTTMLLIASTYDQNEMEGPPFSVEENEIVALYGEHFHIKQLLHQPTELIQPHLQARGLTKANDAVYCLSPFT